MVFVEAAVGSDHNPLILNTSFPLNKVGKPFRFESFWTSESSCKPVIMEAWARTYEESEMGRVCKKLKNCKEKLKDWHRLNFGNLRLQITVLKDQLVDVQKKLDHGFNSELVAAEKGISKKLEDLWQKDAMYWHQRSRIKWLQLGDKNSRFFHLSTIHRRQRNQITKLKDAHGVWQTETKAITGRFDMGFIMEFAENLILRMMEDPKERDRKFREHLYTVKDRCNKTKEMWSLPLRPYGFWTFDRHNAQLFWDPQISQAPGRRDPYDELLQDDAYGTSTSTSK
ncbi:hypothetical protein RHGRI_011772 [Rhododendron griersonianum]|uniref:Uncharacterized protein n=1 Tax=Rhododendron griersonianum TaxID=479676 RepID=A0AAV6KPN1_9ERIC|nr:hypothetical protein RHGRI_011772 [Rhododendron griersonianum]